MSLRKIYNIESILYLKKDILKEKCKSIVLPNLFDGESIRKHPLETFQVSGQSVSKSAMLRHKNKGDERRSGNEDS